jgi:hypothetical protein
MLNLSDTNSKFRAGAIFETADSQRYFMDSLYVCLRLWSKSIPDFELLFYILQGNSVRIAACFLMTYYHIQFNDTIWSGASVAPITTFARLQFGYYRLQQIKRFEFGVDSNDITFVSCFVKIGQLV